MRHPHGLRAAAKVITGLSIGDSYLGGFFAGYISHTANSIATHGLIVAPAASTGYYGGGAASLNWKNANTTTAGTTSVFDGLANSNAMNNASHPAAQYCRIISLNGYTDWYLPARLELDIAYQNLKPTTTSNVISFGINAYAVPARASNRTAGTPAQTSVAAFQSGGAEDFLAFDHWSSTEASATNAWGLDFNNGNQTSSSKATTFAVRAFRKFAL
jgi:hypothetical protein